MSGGKGRGEVVDVLINASNVSIRYRRKGKARHMQPVIQGIASDERAMPPTVSSSATFVICGYTNFHPS